MSPDEACAQEEQYAALLAAFDDALAGAPGPGPTPPADVRPRLEADLACLQLLNQLRPPSAEGAAPPSEESASQPSAEETVERYELIRLHAAGGIGQVWLVHDADLDREV